MRNRFYPLALLAISLIATPSLAKDKTKVHWLRQKDFAHGTVILDQPGIYKLAEDISFNPNSAKALKVSPYQASRPLPCQFRTRAKQHCVGKSKYDPAAYGLGFFAAIAITGHDIVLDLNQHRLQQSKEHALMQRFFANIELADQPFIAKQGPAHFGHHLDYASKVTIKNGTLGRSAHHGIHGNGAKNIRIENVNFEDFEVAALALNGVRGLTVRHSSARSRNDVPVMGTFSNAQFIKPYVEYLYRNRNQIITRGLVVNGKLLRVASIRNALKRAIENVHADVMATGKISKSKHPQEYALFHNRHGIVDGNAFGYLTNPFGFAVNGFAEDAPKRRRFQSRDVVFEDVHVLSLRANVSEVIGLVQDGNVVLDPIGALFQVRYRDPEGKLITITAEDDGKARYRGNILSNAQALVAKAILNGDFAHTRLSTVRNTINRDVIHWIEKGQTLAQLNKHRKDDYVCNSDTMFHVNKGVIGFRIDGTRNVVMRNTSVNNLENIGQLGSHLCGAYVKSHPKAFLPGYGGAKIRGYCFAGSRSVRVEKARVKQLHSDFGSVIGVDIMGNSRKVRLDDLSLDALQGGRRYRGNTRQPNENPYAIAVKVAKPARQVRLNKFCVRQLSAPGGSYTSKGAVKLKQQSCADR